MLIKGYSDFTVKTPDCHVGLPVWVARFRLDTDVSQLFPYINAVAEDTMYYENPHYIKFMLDGIRCALYPDRAVATPFSDREEALSFIKRLIDFLNDLHSRMDSLEPNHKTHRHLSVFEIFKLLPQTNCGRCGFPTCMAFANSLSMGESDLGECADIESSGSENSDKLQSLLS